MPSVVRSSCPSSIAVAAPRVLLPGEVIEIGDENHCCRLETVTEVQAIPRLSAENEAVVDRLRTMLSQESDPAYVPRDYLPSSSSSSSSPRRRRQRSSKAGIDRSCRTKMIQWMYQIVDYCDFSRETVSVASSHLDRFLSSAAAGPQRSDVAASALSDRKTYQLAAMTALYLSVKTNEPVVMTTELLSDVSQGVYAESEVRNMEAEILEALGWRISGPTPLEVARHLLALLPVAVPSEDDDDSRQTRSEILDLVRYQIELAVADYDLSLRRSASYVAVAAVRNVLEVLSKAGRLPARDVSAFLELASVAMGRDVLRPEVDEIMERLASMLRATGASAVPSVSSNNSNKQEEESYQQQQGKTNATPSVKTATIKAQSSAKIIEALSPVCVSSTDPQEDAAAGIALQQ